MCRLTGRLRPLCRPPTLDRRFVAGPDGEPGINGGFMRRHDDLPPTFNTIQVASVAETAEKVKAEGGAVVMERFAIPGMGYQAYCGDTEGNVFGIHQFDPDAK